MKPGTRVELIEIGEAVLLAIVAIATAWTGYQAGRWDGHEAHFYAVAETEFLHSARDTALSGQQRLYDTNTFGFWLQEKVEGREQSAKLFERRFRPEYRPAFQAWLRTDPLHNAHAPPGPIFMPQYKNAAADRAVSTEHHATELFEEGTAARSNSEKYLRDT